jgi:hypothetical protein
MRYHAAILLALAFFVQAPVARAQPPANPQDTTLFVLSSHVDGGFLLNGQFVPAGDLRETLRRTFVGRPIRRLQLDLRAPVDTSNLNVLTKAANDFKIELIALPMRPH